MEMQHATSLPFETVNAMDVSSDLFGERAEPTVKCLNRFAVRDVAFEGQSDPPPPRNRTI